MKSSSQGDISVDATTLLRVLVDAAMAGRAAGPRGLDLALVYITYIIGRSGVVGQFEGAHLLATISAWSSYWLFCVRSSVV